VKSRVSRAQAVALAASTAIGAAANAATVSVSGGITVGSQGSNAVLGINQLGSMNFSGQGSGATVNGLIQFGNSFTGSQQLFTLVLTSFNFTSTNSAPVTIDVNIVQNYAVFNTSMTATGSHQLNGNTTGNRNGSVIVTSTHESTNLPVLNLTYTGAQNIGAQQGATTNVVPIDAVYTINTTYRFIIQGGTGSGSIILPDSGVDNATLVLVPLPPAAWSSIGGLATLGVVGYIRRRKLGAKA
jgi:hypothetical protein